MLSGRQSQMRLGMQRGELLAGRRQAPVRIAPAFEKLPRHHDATLFLPS